MRYWVFYIYGSCRAGDRNGGVMDFETLEEAKEEMVNILKDYSDVYVIFVHGQEIASA